MSFTLLGNDKRIFVKEYLNKRIKPIVSEKPYVASLNMYDIIKLWGIDDITVLDEISLKKMMESRGDVLIIRGHNFENNGPKINIEIKGNQFWNSDMFQMESIITGSIEIDDNGIVSFNNLSGILFGYSYLRWIKIIPDKGVYFRRSWIKNDYFIDWSYNLPDDNCKVGIPKDIEILVGLW